MWDGATRTFDTATSGLPADLPFLFQPADHFGPYVIVRQLGKGGMGQVYEAEETESGRHLAIKILSRGIGDPEELERFLSEGRIAASLSHPNTVYVFGTSEVQGLPVIAMELAPSGTLKEQLVDGKPMASAAAVDAILQVIDGLEAAAAIGILHRDVKPSNCFVDRDGRVLVGDFGLSIGTLAKAEGSPAVSIAGTPGFASPEQLRGEALDVRSDIYSVGATLYYLLTGRPPFEDPDITRLITRVGIETPTAPIVSRADLPKDLSAIVMKCLARTPQERYPDYRTLAAALEPLRSKTLVTAGLIRRFVAGLVDLYAAGLPVIPFNLYFGADIVLRGDTPSLALTSLPVLFSIVLYYGVLEGWFGAAAGKAMLGIRVVTTAGTRPGWGRAAIRATVFMLPGHLMQQVIKFLLIREGGRVPGNFNVTTSGGGVTTNLDPATSVWTLVMIGLGLVSYVVLFSTMRKRNGYRALQDLASGTRVVLRTRSVEARQRDQKAPAPAESAFEDADSRIGPYVVHDRPAAPWVTSAQVIRGFDDRLHRAVWIQLQPVGSAPVPALRRDLGRITRPRWIAGRRTDTEAWDAYEAVDGSPLTDLAGTRQPWTRVRHWTADLSREMVAGLADGSLPTLALDRVWIGSDGRARLFDWAPDGTMTASGAPPSFASACAFLHEVSTSTLAVDQPLPVHARDLIGTLRDGRMASPEVLLSTTDAALRSPTLVRRSHRAVQVALCALFPILIPVIVFFALGMMQRLVASDPAGFDLLSCIDIIREKDEPQAVKDAAGVYLATTLRAVVENPETWKRPMIAGVPGRRAQVEQVIAQHPNPSPEEIARAEALIRPKLDAHVKSMTSAGQDPMKAIVVAEFVAWTLAACLGVVGALIARGGLTLSMFGTAVVRRDGANASRFRTLIRAAIAWLPIGVMLLLPKSNYRLYLPVALIIAGAIWAIVRPSRGIQDRIAGTWLVAK